jgi:hypothetical protein
MSVKISVVYVKLHICENLSRVREICHIVRGRIAALFTTMHYITYIMRLKLREVIRK